MNIPKTLPSKLPAKWQWLLQPLSKKMRKRLDMALGVVVSGAAVVALSTMIRPDPSKYVRAIEEPAGTSIAERRAEAQLRPEDPAPLKTPPAFVTAVSTGDLDTMNKLYTPKLPLAGMLAVAAEAGQNDAVVWLLDHGVDVREDGTTVDAPILAADLHPDTVSLLVRHGAKEPDLATAATAGAPNAVKRLLAAHVPADDGGAVSPLSAAVSSLRASNEQRRAIIDALLAAGADPNRSETDAPLTAAVRSCEVPTDARYDIDECLALVKTLVAHHARTKGDALVATLSIDEAVRGPVFDALLSAKLEPGATAVAMSDVWTPTPAEIKRLAQKRIDWSWHDGEDDAALPLVSAVQRGDRDFVRALLDIGAPINSQFKDGRCALGEAINGASNENAEYARIVELLVARGADVNRRLPDGRTPLFAAAEGGNLRVIAALLDRGARVNDIVLDDTPLDAAEQNNQQAAARVLHARGGRRAPKRDQR